MFGNKQKKLYYFVVTGWYTGLLPWMPGTWASLIAAWLFFLLPELSLLVQLVIGAVLFGAGMQTINYIEEQVGQHDPSWIVIDEWWGMSIALMGVPKMLSAYIVAFVLFRIFDITKLPPINYFERLPGRWGVMLDDGVAGIFALLGTQIFCWLQQSNIF